jgi:hypothetical protein
MGTMGNNGGTMGTLPFSSGSMVDNHANISVAALLVK